MTVQVLVPLPKIPNACAFGIFTSSPFPLHYLGSDDLIAALHFRFSPFAFFRGHGFAALAGILMVAFWKKRSKIRLKIRKISGYAPGADSSGNCVSEEIRLHFRLNPATMRVC